MKLKEINIGVLKKINGETIIVKENKILSEGHLCFDCENAYASKCDKIRDVQKESITDYKFIVDGYQVVKDGKSDKLVVSYCSNFKKDEPRSTKNNVQVRAELKTLYFDCSSIGEANRTQDMLIKNSVISKPTNYTGSMLRKLK